MNATIQQLVKHVSVREFKNERLSDEIKQHLLTAARSASSSHFVQSFSILEITDEKLRKELAEITNSASYVNQTGDLLCVCRGFIPAIKTFIGE